MLFCRLQISIASPSTSRMCLNGSPGLHTGKQHSRAALSRVRGGDGREYSIRDEVRVPAAAWLLPNATLEMRQTLEGVGHRCQARKMEIRGNVMVLSWLAEVAEYELCWLAR